MDGLVNAGGVLSQRRDWTEAHLGWPLALRWRVRVGARGEKEGRQAAPGRHCRSRRCCRRRRSSHPPLLPRQRRSLPPAGDRRQGTPPAPSGTGPGVAGGTAAEPPADEQPCCCHLPPHSPPLPPHRPEVTRQGVRLCRHAPWSYTHTYSYVRTLHIIVTQISTTHTHTLA